MRALLIILLLAAVPLFAAEKIELKERKPIEASITLKDGQMAEGVIQAFDDYFVEFKTAAGHVVTIPWREIAVVQEKELSGASAFFGNKLVEDSVRVDTVMAPLDPGKARSQAMWMGFLVHGWGHRYARDRGTFLSLVGAEAFGLLVAGIGGNDFLVPDGGGDDKRISTAMVITGATFFVGSWLWDIAFAPGKARKFNQDNKLALLADHERVALSLNWKF